MSLNIKDPEAHRLAGQLTRLTGETMTRAVIEALRERLERESRRRREKSLAVALLAIGQRCAAHMRQPATAADHADLLYDDQGLPR